MEERLQVLLADLIRAKYSPIAGKEGLLRQVNIELEVLRFQLRQAVDLRAIPLGAQESLLDRLRGIGDQVGGWTRSLAVRAGESRNP